MTKLSLIFGSIYTEPTIIVGVTTVNPTQVKDNAGDGWIESDLTLMEFPSPGFQHFLTCPRTGQYEVDWSISAKIMMGGMSEINAGVMIDGV